MTIEELAQKNANVVAGYDLVKYFEAACPVYKIELNFTLQKKKPLSILQEFILKFLQENVTSTSMICDFLGINSDVVFNAIADERENIFECARGTYFLCDNGWTNGKYVH